MTLSCRTKATAASLDVETELTNRSGRAIWVLDTLASGTGDAPRADHDYATVMSAAGDSAMLLRGVPPLPRRPVYRKAVPLATPVAPRATLHRKFMLRLPLVEASPYFGELPLRQYAPVSVIKIIVRVHFIPDDRKGVTFTPAAAFGPNLFKIMVEGMDVEDAVGAVDCSSAVDRLTLLTRRDNFPRDPS